MSTKKQTSSSSSNVFNPNSEANYNALNSMGVGALQSEINNPYSNMFFNNQLGMGNQAISAGNSAAMNAITQRAAALGGNNSALTNWNISNQARSAQAQRAGLFGNLLLNAGQMRQGAIGGALSYMPQITGQTSNSSETTSGLGTWLPQVAGLAMGAFTGGASAAVPGFQTAGNLLNHPTNPLPNYGPGMAAPTLPTPGFNPSNPLLF